MKITLVQINLSWESPQTNRTKIESMLEHTVQETDLIVLPEMFTSGFSMNVKRFAESMNGPTVEWMQSIAKRYNAAVAGSIAIVKEEKNGEKKYANRLLFVTENGIHAYYDKAHLFGMAGEDKVFEPGQYRQVVHWRGWDILLQVCYDLRFPVWNRHHTDTPYQLLLNVANWPERRIAHWDTLLKARAIENQCYVVGLNRVGNDDGGLWHNGSSQVITPMGELVWRAENDELCETVTLDATLVSDTRTRLAFLKDADNFEIKITNPN